VQAYALPAHEGPANGEDTGSQGSGVREVGCCDMLDVVTKPFELVIPPPIIVSVVQEAVMTLAVEFEDQPARLATQVHTDAARDPHLRLQGRHDLQLLRSTSPSTWPSEGRRRAAVAVR
jgi:hypothetical protein